MIIIDFIIKNIKPLLGLVIVLLFVLLVKQNTEKAEYKAKFEIAKKIGDENLAAIKDSSIQLKVTKEQLKLVDSNLLNIVNKNDSLMKIKSKIVTITKPIYVPVDVKIINNVKYDSVLNRYGLDFKDFDSIKCFNGISWFKLVKSDTSYRIIPDSTEIKNFKFNFVLIASQYDDPITKFTKAKIIPYYVDSSGNITNPISENLIKFSFRNIELLDKPYVENTPILNEKKSKYMLVSGWGLTVSPIAIGVTSTGLKYTPNVGISYSILLKKR